MKTAGIIAEYNPFHKGHEYQITHIKEQLQADFTVIAMSGDFVQRGTPALFSKYTRTKMALQSGADLVLELPVSVSTASAELFAQGAVQLLDGLGVIDFLSFGSECGDTRILQEIAHLLADESEEFQMALRTFLKEGMNFPKARALALSQMLPETLQLSDVLSSPNNILGIEYCKALLRQKSSISPCSLKRQGNAYHETDLSRNRFPSASAIRQALFADSLSLTQAQELADTFLPASCQETFLEAVQTNAFLSETDLDSLYRYCLLQEDLDSLCRWMDISPDLARRILSCREQYETFSQFVQLLKTKEVTHTRIQRALLHMLLHITQPPKQVSYARVLGFRKSSAPLLTAIKKNGTIPLLSKSSDAAKLLSPDQISVFEETVFASNLYETLLAQKKKAAYIHEYRQPIIIL